MVKIFLDAKRFSDKELALLVGSGMATEAWSTDCRWCPKKLHSKTKKGLEAARRRHEKRCTMRQMIDAAKKVLHVSEAEAIRRLYPEDDDGNPIYPNPFYSGEVQN